MTILQCLYSGFRASSSISLITYRFAILWRYMDMRVHKSSNSGVSNAWRAVKPTITLWAISRSVLHASRTARLSSSVAVLVTNLAITSIVISIIVVVQLVSLPVPGFKGYYLFMTIIYIFYTKCQVFFSRELLPLWRIFDIYLIFAPWQKWKNKYGDEPKS